MMMYRGQWANVWPGCWGSTPILFQFFFMTTETQNLSLTLHPKDHACYSTVSPSLCWGVRTTDL